MTSHDCLSLLILHPSPTAAQDQTETLLLNDFGNLQSKAELINEGILLLLGSEHYWLIGDVGKGYLVVAEFRLGRLLASNKYQQLIEQSDSVSLAL